MGIKKKDKKGKIEIDKSLSIFNAAMIHKNIIDAYSKFDRMEIDLKDVTDCDTAGIQLLISLQKTCDDAGKEFSLINPSEAVIDAMERMSMSWKHINICED